VAGVNYAPLSSATVVIIIASSSGSGSGSGSSSSSSRRSSSSYHHIFTYLQQVCLAYKMLTHSDLPQDAVEYAENTTYTFDDFCCLVSEHRYQSHVSASHPASITALDA